MQVANPRILIVSSVKTATPYWISVFPPSHWQLWMERKLTNITQRLSEITPDILAIEIETGQSSGLNFIRKVRMEAVIPILLLTSINNDDFLINAYEVGVDDCILKPISPRLLRAKFKAWLRHSWNFPVSLLDPLFVGKIRLNPIDRTIVIDDSEPVHLTNLEFRMLYHLLSRRDQIMTTEELCQRIWLDQHSRDATALKNIVYRLRKKIEVNSHFPQYLQTVAGVGYKFVVQ